MKLDIFKGIGVVRLILLLHFTFAAKCLATVGFCYRWRSERPKSNGRKGWCIYGHDFQGWEYAN